MLILLSLSAALASPSPDLQGTWRTDVVMMTSAKVPVIGETIVETHKVALSRITPDGSGGLSQRMETCGMFARSNRKLASTWFPQSFVDSLSDQHNPIEQDGDRVFAVMDPVHLGYDPAVSGGRMPTDKQDPAIRDADHDGNPGTTIHVYAPIVGRVKVYIVQHTRTRFEGAFDDHGVVRGQALVTEMGQASLGATLPMFASNVPLTPVADGSWFRMVRVPDQTSCATLDAAAPAEPGTPAAERAGQKPPRED